MRNLLKKHIVQIIAVITIIAVIAVPFVINEAYKENKGYLTVWGGADVLAYFGAIVSAVGTVVLGVIAWQQNTRLLNLEESTFLASNASSALLTEVDLTGIKSIAVNVEGHDEQIVLTNDAEKEKHPLEYGSIEITCTLEPLDKSRHISLVNVKNVLLVASQDTQKIDSLISASNTDPRFTKVAVSKDCDRFKLTVIMSKNEKLAFIKAIGDYCSSLQIDIELILMTSQYIATELKCRAILSNPDYREKEGVYSHFKTTPEHPPMCFWGGASAVKKEDVHIKTLPRS